MLIRKTQQPAEYPENQIHDAYSTSTTDTYSCNYLNSKYLTAIAAASSNVPNSSWLSLPLSELTSQTNIINNQLIVSNDKVKVGANVHHVRISGTIFFEGMENNSYVWASIRINTDTTSSNIIASGSYYNSIIFPPKIISVNENDLIDIAVNTSSSSEVITRVNDNNTWLLVEIID